MVFLLTSISLKGNCQYNLVTNPSFEMYTSCPITVGGIPYLIDWKNPVISVSPDFMHACNSLGNGVVEVPQNRFGYQLARTGDGYVGVFTSVELPNDTNYNYREYIETELSDSLIAGVEYTISFYVSAADSCGRHTNNVGAYFSKVEIDTSIIPASNLPFQPQFENPVTNDLSDRIGWTLVTGTFIANGGEKYLILGNFRPIQSTTLIQTGWGTFPPYVIASYLFIDDVLVAPSDSLTSLPQISSNEELVLLTINNNEFEIISNFHNINYYEIIDCLGQVIKSKEIISMKLININTQGLSHGIYFIKVKLQNQKIQILKIFKP